MRHSCSVRAVMRAEQMSELRVAPSILSADFARLGEQVAEVMDAGARVVHVDVMDGHFVPPLTIGPLVVQALAAVRDAGCRAGLALNPGTPASSVVELADQLDHVLCMTVNSGWGGQSF